MPSLRPAAIDEAARRSRQAQLNVGPPSTRLGKSMLLRKLLHNLTRGELRWHGPALRFDARRMRGVSECVARARRPGHGEPLLAEEVEDNAGIEGAAAGRP